MIHASRLFVGVPFTEATKLANSIRFISDLKEHNA